MEPTTLAKIADLFLALIKERTASKDKVFTEHVDPLYKEAQVVYTDLRETLQAVLDEVSNAINENVHAPDFSKAVQLIELRRTKHKASRQALRSAIGEWRNQHSSPLPRFEKGILGVMLGGLWQFETYGPRGHRHDYQTNWPHGWAGAHTLQDVIKRLEAGRSSEIDIRHQIVSIDDSWKDVADGYAAIRAKLGKLHKHD